MPNTNAAIDYSALVFPKIQMQNNQSEFYLNENEQNMNKLCFHYLERILVLIIIMDVSNLRKSLTDQIEKNIPLLSSHLLPKRKSINDGDDLLREKKTQALDKQGINIMYAHQCVRANANIDHKSNIRIITCLKRGRQFWEEYLGSNKNGQTSAQYLIKFKKVDIKLNDEIEKLIILGSVEEVKNVGNIFKPAIEYLQKRSKKFLEHQSEFRIVSKKIEEVQGEHEEQEEEIKKEMLDLVDRFKQYAMVIQEDLVNDEKVIDDIGKIQDRQLNSIQGKIHVMKEIIADQRIGFFQLLAMGLVALLLWLFGMIVIIVI